MPGFTIKLPFIDIHLSEAETKRLTKRYTRDPLQQGPVMILNRASGLALDAGPDAVSGKHTCLWQAHAGPWQQWRLEPSVKDTVEIVSASSGLKLTTMETGYEWGETWLDSKLHSDWCQRWRIKPTDDRVAYRIASAESKFALDSGEGAENGRDPHVWPSHWAPGQQWIIVRLPLT